MQANDRIHGAGKALPIAVLTDSAVVRGIVTVGSWFFGNMMKGFPTTDLDGALRHLDVHDAVERGGILSILERCKKEVGSGRNATSKSATATKAGR